MTTSPARRAAFAILTQVEQENAYASALLANLDARMRDDDRALCHELVLGVLRRRLWLDQALLHFANRDPDRIDLPVKIALRIGLYQLRFLSRIPPSAAVDESVKLVQAARLRSAAGLVNAVLRRATREPEYDPAADIADDLKKLAVETSHPRWLIERWTGRLGLEGARALAVANNNPAPLSFRVTARSAHRPIIEELTSAGVEIEASTIAPASWRLARANKVALKLSQDGLIYFQDEASQLAAHLLSPEQSDRVLDVCAAPGSKATLIATLAPRATIVAGDLHEHRLRTLRELAASQNTHAVKAVAYDATTSLPFPEGAFDRVLVDAPCSGTGTLRHNPEIRWRIQPEDLDALASKQTAILNHAAAMVRPGGRLLYSTCSVEPEENEDIVERFLGRRSDFAPIEFSTPTGLKTQPGQLRTWPHRHDVDGFFVALMERSA